MIIACVLTLIELEKHYEQYLWITPFCVVSTQTATLIIPTGTVNSNSVKTPTNFFQ